MIPPAMPFAFFAGAWRRLAGAHGAIRGLKFNSVCWRAFNGQDRTAEAVYLPGKGLAFDGQV
jgi:hypothetical protein